MKSTHGILASLGLIIAAAIVLVFILRINGRKMRRLMDLSDEQQKNDCSEKYGNVFEMLKLVRNNLDSSKSALQQIVPKNMIGMTQNSGLLPRVESSVAKYDLVRSRNFVIEGDMTEEKVAEKIGVVDEAINSKILEQKISKTTENIHELNNALNRLLAAKKRVRSEAPPVVIDDVSGLSSCRPYLPFFLGEELYAVGMGPVQEVLQATRLLVDPSMPEKIRSAINLDGTVVPVIDLSNHFGCEIIKVGRNTLIVVLLLRVDGELQKVGIKVDGVCKIITVDQRNIVPSRAKTDGVRNDLAQGEYKTEHYSITILDFNQEFTSKNILGLNSRRDGLSTATQKESDAPELSY